MKMIEWVEGLRLSGGALRRSSTVTSPSPTPASRCTTLPEAWTVLWNLLSEADVQCSTRSHAESCSVQRSYLCIIAQSPFEHLPWGLSVAQPLLCTWDMTLWLELWHTNYLGIWYLTADKLQVESSSGCSTCPMSSIGAIVAPSFGIDRYWRQLYSLTTKSVRE